MSDKQWAILEPHTPTYQAGGRPQAGMVQNSLLNKVGES